MDSALSSGIPKSCFIAGTGTGVGKTFVATRIIRAHRKAGRDVIGFKPICCGDPADPQALHEACDGAVALEWINPVWFRVPAAPMAASQMESRVVDLDVIREKFHKLRTAHEGIVVEGAGGWKVPIRSDYFMSDLAAEMDLPIILVIANRLGALNETLLTIESIRGSGCQCAGYILNQLPGFEDAATLTNPAILEDLLEIPRLATMEINQSEIALG